MIFNNIRTICYPYFITENINVRDFHNLMKSTVFISGLHHIYREILKQVQDDGGVLKQNDDNIKSES